MSGRCRLGTVPLLALVLVAAACAAPSPDPEVTVATSSTSTPGTRAPTTAANIAMRWSW